ncbi:TolC family protein, partial [candidate division KSB1 bacterium]
MKILKKITLFLLILFINFTANAQEELSLSKAINGALENNYDIQIVKLDEKISEINNSWGAAGRYPTMGFDISSNNQSNFNLNRDYTSTSGSLSLTLNWILFDGFAINIKKQRLDYFSELSKGFTAVLVENTIQSIIKAYYTAILEKEKLAVRKELMDLSKDRYDHALTQKEIGTAVTYEVLQAKNAWLEDKSDFMLQQAIFKNSLRDLNYLMGITDDKKFVLTDKFDAQMEVYNIENLINKMLKDNKTLKNQYVSQKLLEKDIALAKSNYYPTLSLRSGAAMSDGKTKYEDDEISKSKTKNLFANLTLSFS